MNEADVAKQKDVLHLPAPKILYLDLEISPMLSYNYEAYESNALKILVSPMIVSFAWQWEGDKKVYSMCVADYPGYKPGILKLDDKAIAKDLYDIMKDAQLIIGHNIRRFDLPMARARFLIHELSPIGGWQTVDTLTDFKRQFKFPKNNLDYLSELTGGEGKTYLKHSDLIWKCLEGDKKEWDLMKTYNKRDVSITRDLYMKTRGWYTNHPNLSFYTRDERECPVCHSQKVQSRGNQKYFRQGIRQRYQCRDCGKWFYGQMIKDGFDTIKTFS